MILLNKCLFPWTFLFPVCRLNPFSVVSAKPKWCTSEKVKWSYKQVPDFHVYFCFQYVGWIPSVLSAASPFVLLHSNFEEAAVITCSASYSTRAFGGIQGGWGLTKTGMWLMSSWTRLPRKARWAVMLAPPPSEGSKWNTTRDQPVYSRESRLSPSTATFATAWNTKGGCGGCEWICSVLTLCLFARCLARRVARAHRS